MNALVLAVAAALGVGAVVLFNRLVRLRNVRSNSAMATATRSASIVVTPKAAANASW